MATLVRWDPFREMLDLRRRMDRMFDDSFRAINEQWEGGEGQSTLALDVSENEDSYIVKASIPGVNPEDIDITILPLYPCQSNPFFKIALEKDQNNNNWNHRHQGAGH